MEIEKNKGRFGMIFQSFILGNLVSLCMKIINSVVVVGLYYGFLTTFSIGPSYLFLLRARVMEEGTEKKVSATTGFLEKGAQPTGTVHDTNPQFLVRS